MPTLQNAAIASTGEASYRIGTMRMRHGLLAVIGVLAVIAGALALSTGLSVRQGERRFPPIGEFATIDGARLHYVDRGTGSAVVLLHGNPGFVEDFTLGPHNPADMLARTHRVIVVDRPGHGYSARPSDRATTPREQARLVHDLLTALGVRDPVIVGHSWGGGLALVYAEQYRREVRGLVLVGARAFPSTDPPDRVYALNRVPVLGALFRATLLASVGERLLTRRLAAAYAPDSAHPEHVAAARALWLRPGQVAATVWDTRNLTAALDSASGGYGRLDVPTVILVGDHDRGLADSRRLVGLLPHAELHVLRATGHEIPLTRPDTLVSAVERLARPD